MVGVRGGPVAAPQCGVLAEGSRPEGAIDRAADMSEGDRGSAADRAGDPLGNRETLHDVDLVLAADQTQRV